MIVRDKIFLRKKRGFGDLFGTVFKLIRRNFNVFAGSLIVVAGPFLVLASVYSAYLNTYVLNSFNESFSMFRGYDMSQKISDLLANYPFWLLGSWVLALLSYSFVRTTVANFFVIYESKHEGDTFTVDEVARRTYQNVWTVFSGVFVFSIVMLAALGIVAIPFGLLAGTGDGGAIFAIFLVFIISVAFGPQLFYIFSSAPPFVMVRDRVFVFTAVKRTLTNVKGSFWWLWIIMVVMGLMVMLFKEIPQIPAQIISGTQTFSRGVGFEDDANSQSSLLYMAFLAFGMFCGSIVWSLFDMITIVSYYSFEEERTGLGLNLLIDQIGRPEENPNYQ